MAFAIKICLYLAIFYLKKKQKYIFKIDKKKFSHNTRGSRDLLARVLACSIRRRGFDSR